MNVKTVKVNVSDLKIGMSVIDLDRPWLETPFLFQGFTLNSEADIQAVQQYCSHVFIDASTIKSKKKAPVEQAKPKRQGLFSLFKREQQRPPSVEVEKEIKTAKKVHQKSSGLVKDFFDDLRLGNSLDSTAVKTVVNDCVESVLRNPDAMMWLTQIKNRNELEASHAMNTCILAISLGRFLGFSKNDLENLGQCALLHDVGKVQIRQELLEKPTALSSSEQQLLKSHTEKGRMILMSATDIYFGVVDAAYTHHEHVDGSGYPRGLTGAQISPFAKIIAIVDSYDSLTSDTPYRDEVTPFQALKYINREKNRHFDGQMVKHFIDMIGVFPIGSVVELNTHEVGIVISVNRRSPANPKVLVLIGANRKSCRQKVYNLEKVKPPAGYSEVKIAKILKPGDYGIDLQQLKERGLKINI